MSVLCNLTVILIIICLIINEIDHIFTCINNLEFLIWEAPIQVFALFQLGGLYFIHLYQCYVYSGYSLLIIYMLQIFFSHSVSHLCILLCFVWSTEVPNLLYNLSTFSFTAIAFWDLLKMSFSNLKVKRLFS